MYSKDKNVRVTLRLTPYQFEFVKHNADALGVTPTDFLRMIINVAISQTEADKDKR